MTSAHIPTVGIGLPVHNGQDFLADALDSLLAQTFEDFEVVVCDNASTDETPAICRAYAARDPRINVVRNARNIGGARNFNLAYALSRGRLFKWMAHDDVCAPAYLERCVEALEADPAAVCSHPLALEIDAGGAAIGRWDPRPALTSHRPSERFSGFLRTRKEPLPIFGVHRRDLLARTPLIGSYPSSDRILACELALHGRFLEVGEPLFLHREHPNRSVYVHGWRARSVGWWNPDRANDITFTYWRQLRELIAVIRRAPLDPSERLRCHRELAGWIAEDLNWLKFVYDVLVPVRPAIDRAWTRLRADHPPLQPDIVFASPSPPPGTASEPAGQAGP